MGMSMTALLVSAMIAQQAPTLQGSWKITTFVDNGQALNEKEIATNHVSDGLINFDGGNMTMLPPGTFEPRRVVFNLGTIGQSRTIDLTGTARGIFMLSGDDLVLCLSTADDPNKRPTEFSANRDSGRLLMILKRNAGGLPLTITAQAPPQQADKATDDATRTNLFGTWGHQTQEAITYITLNPDNSFSATVEWKGGLQRVFRDNERTSGNWKLMDGVVIANVTTSTNPARRNQVFSYRIVSLNNKELIAIDQNGQTRTEWKVR